MPLGKLHQQTMSFFLCPIQCNFEQDAGGLEPKVNKSWEKVVQWWWTRRQKIMDMWEFIWTWFWSLWIPVWTGSAFGWKPCLWLFLQIVTLVHLMSGDWQWCAYHSTYVAGRCLRRDILLYSDVNHIWSTQCWWCYRRWIRNFFNFLNSQRY